MNISENLIGRKHMILTREWDFVCRETTQRRCDFKNKRNIATRELLFALQLILDDYSRMARACRRKRALRSIYEKTKSEYVRRINKN